MASQNSSSPTVLQDLVLGVFFSFSFFKQGLRSFAGQTLIVAQAILSPPPWCWDDRSSPPCQVHSVLGLTSCTLGKPLPYPLAWMGHLYVGPQLCNQS